jgi:uncharacterized membrane protein YphA (DoxX/SURF4 family)
MKNKTKEILIEIVIILFVVLWLYTGLNKMLDYNNFKSQLEKSPFVEHFATLISRTIPLGEVLIGAILVYKRIRLLGLYLSFALMMLFTGYIWMMLRYAYDLPCSCGGVLAQLSWDDHLWFNSVFVLLSVIAIIFETNTSLIPKRKEVLS